MCGLAGFAGAGDRADLAAMSQAVAHRGPDGEGQFIDRDFPIHLAHRRLAIIDVAGGAQPMQDETAEITVIYNGEIYNHLTLRQDLEAKGHRFRTDRSDTEVLLHGWRQWGTDLPSHLNGMFAFALWDRRRKLLFLARDRFGEKPLYWARHGATLLFASELSALAAHRAFQPEIDRLALQKFFAHGFIPSPHGFWRGSRKLPPASWLLYSLEDGSLREETFWRFAIEADLRPSDDEAAEQVGALLRQSVERRLMSEVPLGVFLSGGIDSSAVAAHAASLRGGAEIQSFCVGFTETSYDESAFARMVAAHLGSRHHERTLTLAAAQALIPEMLRRLDEPMGDPSIIPTFMLCRFAREHVTVALSGDGGDELFAGYDTFAALRLAGLVEAMLPAAAQRGLRRVVELLPKSARNMSLDYKLRRALGGLGRGPELWHPQWLAPLSPDAIADLLQEPVEVEALYSEALSIWRDSPGKSPTDRALEFYTRLYLPDDILTKVDRAAMMNGLEARSVFLDNDLVDYVRRLPADLKLRRGVRKFVLKRACAGLLPPAILHRRKKGFGIPLLDWMTEMPPARPIDGLCTDSAVIAAWQDAHRQGRADHRLFLWCWSVLTAHQAP